MERRSDAGGSRAGRATWIVVTAVMLATAVFVPVRIIYKQHQSVDRKPDGVVIANFTFTPSPLTVSPGTEVTFTNTDGAVHTATASDTSFDSGPLEQGRSFRTKITESVSYYCAIHQYMTGKIRVAS